MRQLLTALLFALPALGLGITPTLADGDAAAGASVFNRCAACHQVGAGAGNGVGPHLNGLFSRPIAGVPGYDYSSALSQRAGAIWNPQLMTDYIADPGSFIGERSRMPAQRLRPDQVANLIAYLQSL